MNDASVWRIVSRSDVEAKCVISFFFVKCIMLKKTNLHDPQEHTIGLMCERGNHKIRNTGNYKSKIRRPKWTDLKYGINLHR